MYPIEGGRYLVVDYVGRFGDEGEYGTHARALLRLRDRIPAPRSSAGSCGTPVGVRAPR